MKLSIYSGTEKMFRKEKIQREKKRKGRRKKAKAHFDGISSSPFELD